jgi:hypothetical protein
MEHDDTKYEVVQTPCTSHYAVPSTPDNATQITVHITPVRTTCAQCTPIVQKTPTSSPSSSTSLDPTLASVLPRKTRSLCDIYSEDATNSFSFFS